MYKNREYYAFHILYIHMIFFFKWKNIYDYKISKYKVGLMNFNGEKEVKEILNVIHGKMIIYNTAFKNSNFCALNDVQYLDIITLILSWTLYYLKVLTLVI